MGVPNTTLDLNTESPTSQSNYYVFNEFAKVLLTIFYLYNEIGNFTKG